jgi:hypothetical protein
MKAFSQDIRYPGRDSKRAPPWLQSAHDRRKSAKLVPAFADRECRVVSATDSYGRESRFSSTGAATFLFKYLLSYRQEAEWTPFETQYFSENLVEPGIERGISGSVAKNSDH